MDNLPLFDVIEVRRPISETVPRQAKRDRAEKMADPVVAAQYERVLRSAAPVLVTFVAADITAQYEKHYGKLTTRDARGLGGLFARMQRAGVIVKTGEARPRANGNATFVYRWNL